MANADKFVNVAIRIKPSAEENASFLNCLKVISNKPQSPVIHIPEKQLTYSFDNIFTEESTQDDVYKELIKPLVDQVVAGYNCTIFAYGQTGTGKTYTMGSNPGMYEEEDAGIIPRVLNDFFKRHEDREIELFVSFYETYNKKVYDLLDNKEIALAVKGFKPQGLMKEQVHNSSDAYKLLLTGGRNRHTGKTKQNNASSRSHAIFTIFCKVKYLNEEVEAKFNLVDLAGSESVRKTGNQGSQFQEGVNINQGLHSIGRVITALSVNSSFVPYRDSMITTILQDSLNQNNYVTLIACASSNPEDLTESIQTLEFAQKAKKVKNRPEINNIIEKYKKENPTISIISCSKVSDTPRPKFGSAVKQTMKSASKPKTPWKRPYPFGFQTSTTAKKKKGTNSTLTSSQASISSTLNDSGHSLFSSTISSVSSTHENLSPIVRKCLAAVEKTMMEKFEETLMQIKGKFTKPSPNVNSPVVPLRQLQNEISRIVRNQIAQESTSKGRARSSPLETEVPSMSKVYRKLDFPRKSLNFDDDSFDENHEESVHLKGVSPIENMTPLVNRRSIRLSQKLLRTALTANMNFNNFPTPQKQNNTLKVFTPRSTTAQGTPEFNGTKPVTPATAIKISNTSSYEIVKSNEKVNFQLNQSLGVRRSTRLSVVNKLPVTNKLYVMNKENVAPDNDRLSLEEDNVFKQPFMPKKSYRKSVLHLKKDLSEVDNTLTEDQSLLDFAIPTPVRRSTRLSMMHINKPLSVHGSDLNSSETMSRKSRMLSVLNNQPKNNRLNPAKQCGEESCKNENLKITSGKPKKSKTQNKKNISVNDGSFSSDKLENYILDILNAGNVKELQKLGTVGPKTASQIYFYRKLNGKFNSISDLKNLPWKGNAYKRFLSANLLAINEDE